MEIGTAIKKIRTEKGLTQGNLAEKCQISQTSLSQIEKNLKRPSAKNLSKICHELNVPEPILHLMSIQESDVPERKREAFSQLYPVIQNMITSLVVKD
jgi:transcriptional regulator with XRE-family HTH domain